MHDGDGLVTWEYAPAGNQPWLAVSGLPIRVIARAAVLARAGGSPRTTVGHVIM